MDVPLRRSRLQVPLASLLAAALALAGAAPARAGHPTGDLPRGVQRSGISAIAREVQAVDCTACHGAHGAGTRGDAASASLLLPAAAESSACLTCHTGVSPDRGPRNHPVGEPLADPSAVEQLAAAGAVLGPGGTVECLSCHGIHGAVDDLAFQPSLVTAERCLVCHPSQQQMAGGGHGMQGRSCRSGSACLECHTLHGAVGPSLGVCGGDLLDPTGCLSCHDGRDAQVAAVIRPQEGHPLFEPNPAPDLLPSVGAAGSLELGTAGDMGCLTCHDTHAPSSEDNPYLLRRPGSDAGTCLPCHAELRPALGSDHDLRQGPGAADSHMLDAMAWAGFCSSCHQVHGSRSRHGWDGPAVPGSPDGPASWACLGCHQPGNELDATEVPAWGHPTDLLLTSANLPWSNTGELPLYDPQGQATDDTQIGRIACLTCHDPHFWSPKQGGQGGQGEGDTQSSFLRDDWEGFCSGCHGEDALRRYRYFHSQDERAEWERQRERRGWPYYEEEG